MSDPTKELRPDDLANQLFDAALAQYASDPREAVRQVINFLSEALVCAVATEMVGRDENARKARFKSVGDLIASAATPPPPKP